MIAKEKTKENITIENTKEALDATKVSKKEKKENTHSNKEKEYIERLQRLQAEFENFRKRTEKEKTDIKENANADLVTKLLEVLDNFELALKHNKDKGITIIHEELNKILKQQGLKKIDTKGKFNPKFHEALIQESGKQNGIILEELQKGYMLNNKLLRASKVKISKKKNG